MWDWGTLIAIGLYLAGLAHHAFAVRSGARAREERAAKQRICAMLQEAVALSQYGAHDEAVSLLSEAEQLDRISD